MYFIYDNLIASVISMTVFLILVSIQMQATQNNTARISRHSAKGDVHQLATWLEEDLSGLGRNMEPEDAAFESPQDSTQWHTTEFTVKYDSLTVGGSTIRVRTRYELKKVGTRTVNGTQESLFEIQRSRRVGSGSWESKGQSTSNLGYFEVGMLDRNANLVANPATNHGEIEFIRVRLSVIAPYQSEDTFLRRVRRAIVVPYRPVL